MYQEEQVLLDLTVLDLHLIYLDNLGFPYQGHRQRKPMAEHQFLYQKRSRVTLYVMQDMWHFMLEMEKLYILLYQEGLFVRLLLILCQLQM